MEFCLVKMRPRICICCGKPMTGRENPLSGNPNLCVCCFSLADGLEEADRSKPLEFLLGEGSGLPAELELSFGPIARAPF